MAENLGDFARFDNPAESVSESVWLHTAGDGATAFQPLQEDITADIAIVGGGITGITTGILLQKAGYDVVVVDAHPVGYGVSGLNSGHLTTMLLDMSFQSILDHFGELSTRAVTLGLQNAIDLIERQVADYRLDCDFVRLPGYLYADRPEQVDPLNAEFEAASRAGLPVSRTYSIPLPFEVDEGILVPNQARFHPLKYVQGLARKLAEEGGRIYENTRITGVKVENGRKDHIVQADAGSIRAGEVVIATHTPIGFRPALQTRLEAFRSYIIGVRSEMLIQDALFWDMADPYHYVRLAHDEEGPLLIIGGEDHRTGEPVDTGQCFRKLEKFARERFMVRSVDYRWSAQLYNPADGLPYVGKIGGTYIATGFSGEGLTFGTLAAQLITDEICGVRNECADILNPNRTKPLASAGGFLSENIGVLTHLVKDRFAKGETLSPSEVPIGEGRICKVDGQQMAVYHSTEDILYLLSPKCTHMGCIVNWNDSEKSWDCPCHGGRFSATGEVLNGPPVQNLTALDIREPSD